MTPGYLTLRVLGANLPLPHAAEFDSLFRKRPFDRHESSLLRDARQPGVFGECASRYSSLSLETDSDCRPKRWAASP